MRIERFVIRIPAADWPGGLFSPRVDHQMFVSGLNRFALSPGLNA
jgi:hypothetical protein